MLTYIIKTFGCQMNFSDSERIVSFMKENGFQPLVDSNDAKLPARGWSALGGKTEEIVKADLIIFNTCGVRASAEHRVFGQINNILKLATKHNLQPKIIVTGCSAHRKDFQETLKGKVDLFISIKDFPGALQKLNLLQQEEQEYKDYLAIQPQYKYKDIAMVPIMTGCNNFCSYCVVPHARGREWSRPIDEIVKEISDLNDKNYREVTLLGQNVNSYAVNFQFSISNFQTIFNDLTLKTLKKLPNTPNEKNVFTKNNSNKQKELSEKKSNDKIINIDFPLLLDILAKQFPKITFKFLTSHPKDLSSKLIDVIKNNDNIPNEIHLPIQAGSDKVLKDMNRPYTQKQYLKLINKIQKEIPGIKITTDVIIGFPTETDKDFAKTVKVFEKVNFSDAFLNKYSPRPGTTAHKLGDPIPWEVKKEREKKLLKILRNKQ